MTDGRRPLQAGGQPDPVRRPAPGVTDLRDRLMSGYGSPEGNVAAKIGAHYQDIDPAGSGAQWKKTTPSGNTGWVEIGAGGGGGGDIAVAAWETLGWNPAGGGDLVGYDTDALYTMTGFTPVASNTAYGPFDYDRVQLDEDGFYIFHYTAQEYRWPDASTWAPRIVGRLPNEVALGGNAEPGYPAFPPIEGLAQDRTSIHGRGVGTTPYDPGVLDVVATGQAVCPAGTLIYVRHIIVAGDTTGNNYGYQQNSLRIVRYPLPTGFTMPDFTNYVALPHGLTVT